MAETTKTVSPVKPENLPPVDLLHAITPSEQSHTPDLLVYDNMESTLKEERLLLASRWENFLSSVDPIDEEVKGKQLALLFMIETAAKANQATTDASRTLWAERFTSGSIDMYGAPDFPTAAPLLRQQIEIMDAYGVDHALPAEVIASCEHAPETPESMDIEEEDRLKIAEVVNKKFETVLALVEAAGKPYFESHEVARLFEQAMEVLKEEDPIWGEWKVELEDNDKLTVYANKRTVTVGRFRPSISAEALKGLTAHELLLHALRAVNGAHYPEETRMRKGLPGYPEAEEGIGVYMEYAVTGKIPDKIVDRYVDISLALGIFGNKPMSRQELLNFAQARAELRSQLDPTPRDPNIVRSEVKAHINRIYRGTRGDKYVGVFTKDIIYFTGFKKIADYIHTQLAQQSADQLLDYLLQGRFDPTNPKHISIVDKAIAEAKKTV